MMLTSRSLQSALLGLALASAAPHAAGSTTFPEALRSRLGLASVVGPGPGCQLCHRDDLGGLKTATKPFARSLIQAGATGANVPSLLSALAVLQSNGTDSDGDGIGDLDELRAGEDPNVPAEGSGVALTEIPLPQTGCALGKANQPSRVNLGWLVLAVLALVRRTRR